MDTIRCLHTCVIVQSNLLEVYDLNVYYQGLLTEFEFAAYSLFS